MKNKQQIKWRAVKVIAKPIKIDFFTKDGKKIWFKGYEGVEVEDPEQLQGKDLVRWLKKNNFNNLAKALKKVLSK